MNSLTEMRKAGDTLAIAIVKVGETRSGRARCLVLAAMPNQFVRDISRDISTTVHVPWDDANDCLLPSGPDQSSAAHLLRNLIRVRLALPDARYSIH